jgi:5-formyltetrahydrofolate cyclo-ligase
VKKKALRERLMAQRKCLPPEEIKAASGIIGKKLISLPEVRKADIIMAYASFGCEVSTEALIGELVSLGKKITLPVTVRETTELIPVFVDGETKLSENSLGVPEPLLSAAGRSDPGKIEIILVPGVAFDRSGNRIGFGYRYYDRFMESLSPETVKIALAFDMQLVEGFTPEPHDVPVDIIVTEKEVIRCRLR